MPTVEIKIDKGAYESIDPFEFGNNGNAATFKNGLIDETGTNVSRPSLGSTAFADTGFRFGLIGITYFSSHLVVVDSDRKIFKIDSSGTVTLIGDTDLDGTDRVTFATDGDFLAIAGGGKPKTWSGSGMTTDMAGSPPDTTHINYLDGYWILHLNSDQEMRFAGPTAATRLTWSSNDYFQAEGLPDDVVSQEVLIREFFAIGSDSTAIFFNYGDTVTPFKRTFFIDKGTVAAYSVIQADNTLWWLDSDRRFIKMVQRTPQMISSPYDSVIRGFSTVSDCFAVRIDIDGHYLIAWTFPTEEKTYVYDYRGGNWFEWEGFAAGNATRFRMGGHIYVEALKKHFVADPTVGKVWELKMSNHIDGTEARRFLRETGVITHGTTNRKKSKYYDFMVKRGVGAVGGTEPLMEVSVRDDNKPFGQSERFGLGNPGDDEPVIRVRMPGIYRTRELRILMTDAYEFKLRRIQENVEVLTS